MLGTAVYGWKYTYHIKDLYQFLRCRWRGWVRRGLLIVHCIAASMERWTAEYVIQLPIQRDLVSNGGKTCQKCWRGSRNVDCDEVDVCDSPCEF